MARLLFNNLVSEINTFYKYETDSLRAREANVLSMGFNKNRIFREE